MIERGQDLRFALEAREPLGIRRKRVGQDLQRDVALQAGVARAVDLTHAAGAKDCADLIDSEARARSHARPIDMMRELYGPC